MRGAALFAFLFVFSTLVDAYDLTGSDKKAALRAAGFMYVNNLWVSECGKESLGTGSAYLDGNVTEVIDINNDGIPDVLITEESSFCYGNTGIYTSIVVQKEDGSWYELFNAVGFITILKEININNWSDFEVSGPGFCFPIYRFKNDKYIIDRFEYRGKECN